MYLPTGGIPPLSSLNLMEANPYPLKPTTQLYESSKMDNGTRNPKSNFCLTRASIARPTGWMTGHSWPLNHPNSPTVLFSLLQFGS